MLLLKWFKYSILFIIFYHTTVFAHGLKIFANVDHQNLQGIVYFAGGSKATGITVKLFSPQQQLIAETTTDAQGRFSFNIAENVEPAANYELQAETIDGHLAKYVIKTALSPSSTKLPSAKTEIKTDTEITPATLKTCLPVLEPLITHSLNQQLQPLKEQLARYESKIRWHDVLGGIGYIFGLMGIVFYLKSRQSYHRMSANKNK